MLKYTCRLSSKAVNSHSKTVSLSRTLSLFIHLLCSIFFHVKCSKCESKEKKLFFYNSLLNEWYCKGCQNDLHTNQLTNQPAIHPTKKTFNMLLYIIFHDKRWDEEKKILPFARARSLSISHSKKCVFCFCSSIRSLFFSTYLNGWMVIGLFS